jgi:glycosyltransferase involved in cell wall biosynthesis
MKITVITSPFGYIPPFGFGAVERLWYNLSVEWVKEGHEVFFLSKKNKEDEQQTIQDGISIKYLKGYSRSKSLKTDIFLDFFFSFRALYNMKKTDILVLNTFWSPLICFLFFWKYKKTVYNVARFPKGQFRFFKHIDRLSCVSQAVYDELITQTPSIESITNIINYPINTEVFKYSSLENTDSEKLTIVYTGRVHPEKGLTILVEAVDLLMNDYPFLELEIVGPRTIQDGGGGDDYVNKLNALATNFSIIWCDPISDPILLKNKIIKGSIYCYPSVAEKGETFGVAPLEAMATGRATIVSNLGCFKDFVHDQKNGLIFDHNNKNAVILLKKQIEILVNNKELRLKLGLEAHKTSLNFTNEKIANLHLKDFDSLLNNS